MKYIMKIKLRNINVKHIIKKKLQHFSNHNRKAKTKYSSNNLIRTYAQVNLTETINPL